MENAEAPRQPTEQESGSPTSSVTERIDVEEEPPRFMSDDELIAVKQEAADNLREAKAAAADEVKEISSDSAPAQPWAPKTLNLTSAEMALKLRAMLVKYGLIVVL